MTETVYLAAPSYDGMRADRNAQHIYMNASKRDVVVLSQTGSLLALGFNEALCRAYNGYKEDNAKWFAMIHADILPDGDFWIDALIAEADKVGADMMSAVVPIKSGRGLTSTAFSDPANPWGVWCRFTQKQIWSAGVPETFDATGAKTILQTLLPEPFASRVPDGMLLVNTGCFVCRIDRLAANASPPWFTITDQIVQTNGQWCPQTVPEDWQFSKMLAERGHSVYATRVVPLTHWGGAAYRSTTPFGSDYDTDWLKDAS